MFTSRASLRKKSVKHFVQYRYAIAQAQIQGSALRRAPTPHGTDPRPGHLMGRTRAKGALPLSQEWDEGQWHPPDAYTLDTLRWIYCRWKSQQVSRF